MELKFQNQNAYNFIKISTKNDINALENALENYLNTQDTDGIMLSSLSLIHSCKNASEAINRAKKLLDESCLELFAFELNLAIDELAKFTKNFDRSEILDEMFSHFCLGK